MRRYLPHAFIAAFILAGFFATPAHAAVAVASYCRNSTGGTTASTLSCTLNSVSAGDLIVVMGSINASDTASIADTGLDSFANATLVNWNSGAAVDYVYYAKNVAGVASDTVTVTMSAAHNYSAMWALDVTGADIYGPLDATSTFSGTASSYTSGSSTTKFANELLLGLCDSSGGTVTPGAGFTEVASSTNTGNIVISTSTTATGTYSAKCNNSFTNSVAASMATFEPAGSNPPPPARRRYPIVIVPYRNIPWVATTTPSLGSFDAYLAFSSGTVGSVVTTSTLQAGTIQTPSNFLTWSQIQGSTTAQTIQSSTYALPAQIKVNGTTYTSSTFSQAYAIYNMANDSDIEGGFGNNPSQVTISGWMTLGPPDAYPNGHLYDLVRVDVGGSWSIVQLNNGNASSSGDFYGIRLHSQPTSTVLYGPSTMLTPGSTYWYSFKSDANAGMAYLALYNASDTLLSTSSLQISTGTFSNFYFGNAEAGTSTATTTFQQTLFDWTNANWPIAP